MISTIQIPITDLLAWRTISVATLLLARVSTAIPHVGAFEITRQNLAARYRFSALPATAFPLHNLKTGVATAIVAPECTLV